LAENWGLEEYDRVQCQDLGASRNVPVSRQEGQKALVRFTVFGTSPLKCSEGSMLIPFGRAAVEKNTFFAILESF
jgi:hypothetical protein